MAGMVGTIIAGVGFIVAGCVFFKKKRWKPGFLFVGFGLAVIGVGVGVIGT